MTNAEFRTKYNGKSGIGLNPSDKGECVGIYNVGMKEVHELTYPIQGVSFAKDLLEGNNTRKDLLEIVYNDPNNDNQLPSIDDWIVFGGAFPGSKGMGHVGQVVAVTKDYIDIFDQFAGNPCAVRRRFWGQDVRGWIHYKATGDKPMTPQQENEAYQIVLERPMEHGGSRRTGFEFIKAAVPELTAKRSAIAQTIQGLQEALKNEQNRPPKEVIKEVEKVVTEYVDRPVEIVKYVEVEPSWLTRLKNFFKNLKIKKG